MPSPCPISFFPFSLFDVPVLFIYLSLSLPFRFSLSSLFLPSPFPFPPVPSSRVFSPSLHIHHPASPRLFFHPSFILFTLFPYLPIYFLFLSLLTSSLHSPLVFYPHFFSLCFSEPFVTLAMLITIIRYFVFPSLFCMLLESDI